MINRITLVHVLVSIAVDTARVYKKGGAIGAELVVTIDDLHVGLIGIDNRVFAWVGYNWTCLKKAHSWMFGVSRWKSLAGLGEKAVGTKLGCRKCRVVERKVRKICFVLPVERKFRNKG